MHIVRCTPYILRCISVRYMLHQRPLHVASVSVACSASYVARPTLHYRYMLHQRPLLLHQCLLHGASMSVVCPLHVASVRCMSHQRPLHSTSASVACCISCMSHQQRPLHVASALVRNARRVPLLGVQVFDGPHELPEEVLPRHPQALAKSRNRVRRVPSTAFKYLRHPLLEVDDLFAVLKEEVVEKVALHHNWAHRQHIRAGAGLTPATSAPGFAAGGQCVSD